MNELIKTQQHESGQILVSGRELHEFLEVGTKYHDWFKRMSEYGFELNVDYVLVTQKRVTNNPKNPTAEFLDHHLTIDTAKEISMLQRNEKGKQARQYFIEVEKRWNSPEMIIKRAHELLEQKVAALTTSKLMLEQQNKELKPKADYVDKILKSTSLVTIGQIAKDYGLSAIEMNKLLNSLGVQYKQSGQWLLYSKYHAKGYTHSETVDITRRDGRADVKMNTKWTQKGRLFLYELLKSEDIVPTIEKEMFLSEATTN